MMKSWSAPDSSLPARAVTPKNVCGISSGLADVTAVVTPGKDTLTCSRSPVRWSAARQAPDHINPP